MSERSQVFSSAQVIEPLPPIKSAVGVTAAPACRRDRKVLDRFCAALGLCVLSPILVLVALAVSIGDGWPIFFRQERVGRAGKRFQLLKFRTMRKGKSGPSITARGDARITATGGFLRKFKLDELPQLWNVVRGEMSLVGPRPEVPQFVDMNDSRWSSVLQVRPGITDPASIAFRNEEEILAKASDPISFYREHVLPAKLALNMSYLGNRSLWLDMKVILQTVRCATFPNHQNTKGIGIEIPKC
jgi:lipopolysaccharide/colanic/teichoic acid biosynthesis glycosyltransferase